jgi:adenomatosis polyposis coli protein
LNIIFLILEQLTPKQKRQLTKERYKTYTIAAERSKKEQSNGKGLKNFAGKCSPFSKLTPKQRRQEDRARFQTQILDTPILDKIGQSDVSECESVKSPSAEKSGIQSIVKTGIPMLRKFGSAKKSLLRTNQNAEQGSRDKHDKRALNYESTSRDCYKEVEKTAACCDETKASFETFLIHEQNNESEQIILDYVCPSFRLYTDPLHRPDRPNEIKLVNGVSTELNIADDRIINASVIAEDKEDSDEEPKSDSEKNSSDKEERQACKGPRIVKPGTVSRDLGVESNSVEPSELETPKAIRGRRKALYSTPNTRKSTPQSSPLKQAPFVSGPTTISRSNTSPMVRPTRATTLRQNNSFQKSKSAPKMSINAIGATDKPLPTGNNAIKRISIPQKGAKTIKRFSTPGNYNDIAQKTEKSEMPFKQLERQGTFVKDEPEMENVPLVLPMSSSKPISAKAVNSSECNLFIYYLVTFYVFTLTYSDDGDIVYICLHICIYIYIYIYIYMYTCMKYVLQYKFSFINLIKSSVMFILIVSLNLSDFTNQAFN